MDLKKLCFTEQDVRPGLIVRSTFDVKVSMVHYPNTWATFDSRFILGSNSRYRKGIASSSKMKIFKGNKSRYNMYRL